MSKKSYIIPLKKLKITDNNIRMGRLSSQLKFLAHCSNIELEYTKFMRLKKFFERQKNQFYKFTGKIKRDINYNTYIILYTYKYLKYNLKLKNISLKITRNYAYN